MSCRRASVRGPEPATRRGEAPAIEARGASARVPAGAGAGVNGDYQLYLNSNFFWLAGAEGNDAPDRIVRRDADGHAITRDYLDAEAAHSAAELGEYFVAGVALHAV